MKLLRAGLVALALSIGPMAMAQQGSAPLVLIANNKVSGPVLQWSGGIGTFTCVGVWNGATVTLQFLGPDGTTMVTAGAATTLTANGAGVFYLHRVNIQAVVTAAGGSTALTCVAQTVPTLLQ